MNPESKVVEIMLTAIQGQLSQVLSELAHIVRLEHRVEILWGVSIILFAATWGVSEWRLRQLKRYVLDLRKRVEELESA